MKKLKMFTAILTMLSVMVCTGCGSNPLSTTISPVEDSGERVSCNAFSTALPKGWEQSDAATGYDGFILTKGFLNSINVLVMDSATSEQPLDSYIDSMKSAIEATGVTTSAAEVRSYSYGDGIFISASGEITQELVDSNVANGMCTEDQAKQLKSLIGQSKNEAIVYFFTSDKIIAFDGITLGDDAAGIEEVTEFLANNMEEAN